jgi:arylsulfatase B
VSGWDLHRDRVTITNSTLYSTTLYTAEASKIIAAHAQQSNNLEDAKPLFLYLPYQAVHVGNKPTPAHPEYAVDQAPARYIEPYHDVADVERRNLSGMVAAMDEAAGNVTESLKTNKLWGNTLFIFSTDVRHWYRVTAGCFTQLVSEVALRMSMRP